MLKIRDLTKVYPGPVKAVDAIDLDVPAGMFGLLGPNGAGKTTLMRMIAGLLEPTTGTIELDGQDIVAAPEKVWACLGYLPQEFGFYPHLTGRRMLAQLLRLKGLGEDRSTLHRLCDELLAAVNLTNAADSRVASYSGGMRQRLGLAQALAGDPRLIIVDEPTAGLDPEERLRFYRLLAELADARIVLLSTHIVDDVAVLCPHFAILRAGRLVESTTPSKARSRLAGRIFEATVARRDLNDVLSRHWVTQNVLVEGRHQVRVYQPDGHTPDGFAPVDPSLEDAYLVTMQSPERQRAELGEVA